MAYEYSLIFKFYYFTGSDVNILLLEHKLHLSAISYKLALFLEWNDYYGEGQIFVKWQVGDNCASPSMTSTAQPSQLTGRLIIFF